MRCGLSSKYFDHLLLLLLLLVRTACIWCLSIQCLKWFEKARGLPLTSYPLSQYTLPQSNNNNNNPICKAPECQKTSVALDFRGAGALPPAELRAGGGAELRARGAHPPPPRAPLFLFRPIYADQWWSHLRMTRVMNTIVYTGSRPGLLMLPVTPPAR